MEGSPQNEAELKKRFHEAMLTLYETAKAECNYNPTSVMLQ